MLTPQQQATLKADILATPELAAQPNNTDGAFAISAYYAIVASPDYIVWKTNVTITKIGDNIVASELAGLSTLNSTRLQTIVVLSAEGVNPSLPDRRAFFDDIFSGAGGQLTRAKLLVLWKRLANRGEKLLKASGSGTDGDPAIMGFEGALSLDDVIDARKS